MRTLSLLLITMAAFLAAGAPAAGQSLLDKVEKGIEGARNRGARPPAADAAVGEPAVPRAGAVDDLPPPATEENTPKSGYLGVGLEIVDGGIVLTEIAPDSPAAKSGLKVGDKIKTVNKAAVADIEELGVVMGAVPPGGKLTLGIERGIKSMTIVATLVEPPSPMPAESGPEKSSKPDLGLDNPLGPATSDLPPPAIPAAPEPSDTPKTFDNSGRASLGITVVTYDEEARERSDVPARSGALITAIRPLSPADRAGLALGGVIVRFEGERIETADQLVAAIAASRPGQEVELSYYQGSRLVTKSVTLVGAADSSLLAPGVGGTLRDRPPVASRPRAAIDDPSSISPPSTPLEDSDTPSLRKEIEALKARISTLESRLAELESKLPAPAPEPDANAAPGIDAGPPAAAPVPLDDAAPTIRPSTRRPSTKAPGAKIGDE